MRDAVERVIGTAIGVWLGLHLMHAMAADAKAPPPAPTSIVIVACRADDLTGQPGRQDPGMAAQGWRDLELHVENGEYECKREVIANLEDAAQFAPDVPRDIIPLHPDFGVAAQCGAVAMALAPDWEKHHPGWAVVAVGCPTKITADGPEGAVVGWKLPECPEYLPGTQNKMSCKFDGSAI